MNDRQKVNRHATQTFQASIDFKPAKLSNYQHEHERNSHEQVPQQQQTTSPNSSSLNKSNYRAGGGIGGAKLPYNLPYKKQMAIDSKKNTNATLYRHEDQNKYFNIIHNSSQQMSDSSLEKEDVVKASVGVNAIKLQQPLLIGINQRPSQTISPRQNGQQPQQVSKFQGAHYHQGNESSRENVYSQKKGVDVTRLIKQRQDVLAQERVIVSRQQKNNQLRNGGSDQSFDQDDINSLSNALSIKQQKATLTSIEQDQLTNGMEGIVRTLLFPEMSPEYVDEALTVQSQDSDQNAQLMVSLEPLEIGFEPTLIFPQSAKEAATAPASVNKRRALILPGRNSFEVGKAYKHRQFWQQKRSEERNSQEQRDKRLVEEQTRILLQNLTDEDKQKFIKIFNEVPLQKDQRDQVVNHLEEKMLKIKTKLQKQELVQIKKDMIASNKKMQEINERFGSPNSVNSSSEAAISYMGKKPMSQPPYTINYIRDRRERVERRANGLPPPEISKKMVKSDEEQQSLPELMVCSSMQPPSPTLRNAKRLHSQQTTGGERARMKQQLRNKLQQSRVDVDEVLSDGLNSSQDQSLISPKSQIMKKYQQRVRKTNQSKSKAPGIFAVPKENLNKFRVGNSLLFQQKKTKSDNHSRQSMRNNTISLKARIPTNPLLTDDSVFTTPDFQDGTVRASLQPGVRESLSIDQTPHESMVEVEKLNRTQCGEQTLQYSKFLSLTASRDPVKIEESFVSSGSRVNVNGTALTKNQSNVMSGRLQTYKDYSQQLINSLGAFEGKVSECDLTHEAFNALVQSREQELELAYSKSFKLGRNTTGASIPSQIVDLVTALVDGYQSSLAAFKKFCHRQKQQTDYKIERLSRVNEDLKQEINKSRVYDRFLKAKLNNLKEEMNKIEEKILKFNDTTLLGISRDMIQDSFSEVTGSLEQIANDLGQDRVQLVTSDALDSDSGANGPEGDGKASKGAKQARVSNIHDIVPFKQIKKQIDNNYCEIQKKTTKAVINRLGLGTKRPEFMDEWVQTVEDVVSAEEFQQLQMQLFDAQQLNTRLEEEIKKLSVQMDALQKDQERKKDDINRQKQAFKDKCEELYHAQMRIGELETQLASLEAQLDKLQQLCSNLESELKTKAAIVQEQEKIVVEAKQEAKKAVEQIEQVQAEYVEYKQESAHFEEKIEKFQETVVEKEEKIVEQAQELVQIYQEKEQIQVKWWAVKDEISQLKQELQDNKKELKEMFEHYQSPNAQNQSYSSFKRSQDKLRKSSDKTTTSQFIEAEPQISIPLPDPKPVQKLSSRLIDQDLVKPKPVEIVEEPVQPPQPEPKPQPQRESDQTLKLEGPVSSQVMSQKEIPPQEPIVQVTARLTEEIPKLMEPEIKADDSESAPKDPTALSDKVRTESVVDSVRLPPMNQGNPLSERDKTDSDVSSSEHNDRIADSIDVIGLRKTLKRQSTICPTRHNIRHTAAQTEISGPIMQDINAPKIEIVSQNSTNQQWWQPIYAFSYNKELAGKDTSELTDEQRRRAAIEYEMRKKTKRLKNQGNLGRSQYTDEDTCLIKVDKTKAQKAGKLYKGTVFAGMTSKDKKNEEVKMNKTLKNGNLHKSNNGVAGTGIVGEGLESRIDQSSRLSAYGGGFNNTINLHNKVIKKHSSFFMEEPMFRTLNPHHSEMSNTNIHHIDNSESPKKKSKKRRSNDMATPKTLRKDVNKTNTALPMSYTRMHQTDQKPTNLQIVSSFQRHEKPDLTKSKASTNRRMSEHKSNN